MSRSLIRAKTIAMRKKERENESSTPKNSPAKKSKKAPASKAKKTTKKATTEDK